MKNWLLTLTVMVASSFVAQCTSNKINEEDSVPTITSNTDTSNQPANNQTMDPAQVPSAPRQQSQAPVGQGGSSTPPPAPVKDGVAQPILPGGLPAPPPNQPPPPPVPMPMPGSDKDAHGCKSSAGYSWSILKQNCIRTFESCTRLNKIQPSGNAQLSAFVLFSGDNSKAELFIPGTASVILLKSNTGKFWFNEAYRLEKTNNQITLSEWDGHINPRAKMGTFKLPSFKPTYSSK